MIWWFSLHLFPSVCSSSSLPFSPLLVDLYCPCISPVHSCFTLWSQHTALQSGVWSAASFRSSWPSLSEWAGHSQLRTSRCGCRWLSPEENNNVSVSEKQHLMCHLFYFFNNATKSTDLPSDVRKSQLKAKWWVSVLPAQRTWDLLLCPAATCLPRWLLWLPGQTEKKTNTTEWRSDKFSQYMSCGNKLLICYSNCVRNKITR